MSVQQDKLEQLTYLNGNCALIIAQALRDVPEVNSAWMGNFIRQYDSVDVSVAVQTPDGLMVPVIRNTDTLGLSDINAQVKALAAKVRFLSLSKRLRFSFQEMVCFHPLSRH